MRRTRWLAVLLLVLAGAIAASACSDDGDDRSDRAPSSRPTTSTTTAATGTTAPPENEACALVTQADAEAVFGGPARQGNPIAAGEDAQCVWKSDGDGPEQTLMFWLHEQSGVISIRAVSGAPVNITVQRSVGGRAYAFVYVADAGDADAKRVAVNDLADSVIARAE